MPRSPRIEPSAEVVALADERALARAGKSWAEADRLRDQIEAAGWKVVDAGFSYRLEPTRPPTVESDGVVRYGSSADVPSRLDETAVGFATIVMVASGWPDDLERAMVSIVEHAADGCQVVIVLDAPSAEEERALLSLDASDPGQPGIETEVVLTSDRLGHAAALNAAIRRSAAPIVVVLDPSVELVGDAITPLVAALADQTVAVAGAFGLVSSDMRRFEEASGTVDAVAGSCQAFRRSDYVARGPLEEKFVFYRNLDIWWSLVLRDEGEGRAPRTALALEGLPVVRHEDRGWSETDEAERARQSKRNFYRILDRFRNRLDLVGSGSTVR